MEVDQSSFVLCPWGYKMNWVIYEQFEFNFGGGGGEQTQKLKTCLYIFVQQTNQVQIKVYTRLLNKSNSNIILF